MFIDETVIFKIFRFQMGISSTDAIFINFLETAALEVSFAKQRLISADLWWQNVPFQLQFVQK